MPTGIPDHSQGYAFLCRHVATPCFETLHFLESAKQAGLLPVLGDFSEDKFCTKNATKLALGRMGFQCGFNRHGHRLVEFVNVVRLDQRACRIGDLKTLWNQNLIAFHHELLAHALNSNRHPFVHDYSAQCTHAGNCPTGFYRHYLLRICLADLILFEDFLLDEQELPFTRDIVLPAFDAVTAEYGLKPLIVRLTSAEEETSPHWLWYPGELKPFVQDALRSDAGVRLSHHRRKVEPCG
ncbi:MAG: hypothetical protein FJ395_12410 [Verrucomicrobia bacterium]|nr:hypothetical protein [Verrucomicrobiota bacterium]